MKTIKLDKPFAGLHITAVAADAIALADSRLSNVEFDFNGVTVIVCPGETAEAVAKRWDTDRETAHQAWIASPEYKEQERQRAEEWERKTSSVLVETASTEDEMRETKDPWPYTRKQLDEYIESLVSRSHDYGTCCYAMSLAAVAAFNYVAHKLGSTGFQASCADLDFIRRSRGIKGPFIILKAEDALYPQYNLPVRLAEAMETWRPWLKEQAEKNLLDEDRAHPDVIAHWRNLADAKVDVAD